MTGHQASHWHPGIFAKYLAARQWAQAVGGSVLHVIVDQDVYDPFRVEVPVVIDGKLSTHVIAAQSDRTTPVLRRSGLKPSQMVALLKAAQDKLGETVLVSLQPLIDAWDAVAIRDNRVQTTAAEVLAELMRPYCGEAPSVTATQLLQTKQGQTLIERMVQDARRCVFLYNRAAMRYPEAGLRPLAWTTDVVELPLWAIGPKQRTPVFVDLGDSRRPVLFTQGQPLEIDSPEARGTYLAPRASLLTALMRSAFCDLFIHGQGGELYDRVTEQWWGDWVGQSLAPKVIVSADVHLDFDVHTAGDKELEQAVWLGHNLPHNIDRMGAGDGLDPALLEEKAHIIKGRASDFDKHSRMAARRRLREINAEFAKQQKTRIDAAEQDVSRARLGVANTKVAARRDWSFGLYPSGKLAALQQLVADSL